MESPHLKGSQVQAKPYPVASPRAQAYGAVSSLPVPGRGITKPTGRPAAGVPRIRPGQTKLLGMTRCCLPAIAGRRVNCMPATRLPSSSTQAGVLDALVRSPSLRARRRRPRGRPRPRAPPRRLQQGPAGRQAPAPREAARLRHRLRRDGPDPRPEVDGRGQAAEPEGAGGRGHLREARLDAAVRVAHGLVELRDRRQPGQAQHLRLPHPGPGDLLPRPEHGPEGPKDPPEFLWGLIPTEKPKIISMRGGTSFWKTASADGISSVVLTVPVTFPPEELHHGEMLGGLPLPDLRGNLGTFYYWATDLSSYEEGNTEFGGFLKRLLFDGGVSETFLKGPQSPILRHEEKALKEKKKAGSLSEKEQARLDELATGKDINIPMTVRWTEGQGRADIEIQGHRLSLEGRRLERVDPAHVQGQRPRARARDDAVPRDPGRPRAAPLRLARQHGPARPAVADLEAGLVLGGPRRRRSASTARSGGRSRRTSRSTRGGSTRPSSSTTPTGRWTTARRSSSRT